MKCNEKVKNYELFKKDLMPIGDLIGAEKG